MQRYKILFSPSTSGCVSSEISCGPSLAGIELILFTAVGMVLCFRFVTKMVLIAH